MYQRWKLGNPVALHGRRRRVWSDVIHFYSPSAQIKHHIAAHYFSYLSKLIIAIKRAKNNWIERLVRDIEIYKVLYNKHHYENIPTRAEHKIMYNIDDEGMRKAYRWFTNKACPKSVGNVFVDNSSTSFSNASTRAASHVCRLAQWARLPDYFGSTER